MGQYTRRHESAGGESSTEKFAARDEVLGKKFPALVEFLTERLDDEGKSRVTSTLGVSCEEGLWKVCLTDRAQAGGKFDYKLWRSAESLQDAFAGLNKALVDGTADWRRFPKWSGKK